jgi:hypothetical protein
MREAVSPRHVGERGPELVAGAGGEVVIAVQDGAGDDAPGVEVFQPLLEAPAVAVVVGDVVDHPHVGVEREHVGALGLGQELESVVEVSRLGAGERFAERARVGERDGGFGRAGEVGEDRERR